ncbi:MAG TPA: response regulator transcription factor, partial [Chitinophagaceae bacterium]|nr:response regulator transcription factor [Chitinophagaceae bacterium]
HAHPSYFKNMMQMGARGYVTKNSSKEEIVKAINEVHAGNKYVCAEIKNAISGQLLEGDDSKPHLGVLTGRELEIINYIKEGLSSKEIAGKFFIALKTVEVHRHNILKKLKLKNSTSLVNFVHQNGG